MRAGLSIHLMTASGALTGFLALEATINGNIRRALLWLVVCQILDGIDGPIARRLEVHISAPHFDGHILDLVVDYVTCVVVPTMLLVKLDLAPKTVSGAIAGAILISSALWFARVDQETDDAWFRGFPAMWNIVIPSFIILDSSQTAVVVICLVCCLLQLTNVEFPHVVRARHLRRFTVVMAAIYFSALTALSASFPTGSKVLEWILLVAPLYLALIVTWRMLFHDRVVFGQRIREVDTTD